MTKNKKILFCTLALLIANCTPLQSNSQDSISYDQKLFRTWLVDFAKDAEKSGISENTIYSFLRSVEFLPKVIELDRKQPDSTKTFNEYIKIVAPSYKVKEAKQKLKENEKILNKVSKKYKVQPRFIVALWAIESDFGKNMGNFNVTNALATLAFEGRRSELFRKELIDALKIIDEDGIAQSEMKGSWAGAMGQTQFMPSSFLKLAVDGNKDGKKDIWNTKEDVFSSIANYLSTHGWDQNKTWGREVKLPKDFNKTLIGRDTEKTLSQWSKLGVKTADGKEIPVKGHLKASIIKPEADKDRAYLIYSNYKTVLKWNRSLYFATAVGILSDEMSN